MKQLEYRRMIIKMVINSSYGYGRNDQQEMVSEYRKIQKILNRKSRIERMIRKNIDYEENILLD